METTLIAIILGLFAALGWGISGFFDAKASRAIPPIVASLMVNGILTALFIASYFAFLHQGFTITQAAVFYAASGGAIIALGALSYFKGLGIGPVSLVAPMSSAYPIVTTVVAVIAFNSTLSGGQGIALCLILAGILTVTDAWRVVLRRAALSPGPLLGLFTALCWGIGYALVAQAVQQAGWQQATLIELVAMMLAFGLFIPFLKDRKSVTTQNIITAAKNSNVLLASVLALGAALSFNAGLGYDPAGGAIVAALSAFYPILVVILALRHFEETVQTAKLLGVAMSILGVILLTVL